MTSTETTRTSADDGQRGTRPVVVQKYGGSSVSDAEKIRQIAANICDRRQSGADLVVVVSAMGDSTDELIALSKQVVGEARPPSPREMDTLLSTGELVTSTLMAMALQSFGREVVSLSGLQAGIRTDPVHGAARIAAIDTGRLRQELAAGRIIIVAGFQGYSEEGDVTTLGRGGSDTTAVALAAALGAERCEIYTDVEGIFTTDPRLVPEARKLDEVNFEEMIELAALGAKMSHRSIELAAVYDIPILVTSTFGSGTGTLIHSGAMSNKGEGGMEVRKAVTGIAVDRNVAKITVRGVKDRPGVAAGLLQPLADHGISVDVIVQNTSADGTTDFTYTVAEADAQRAAAATRGQSEIEFEDIDVGTGLAKISIVGTGMLNTPGYAATMFSTLAAADVNIDMITTSEIRITCILQKDDVQSAAQALHKAFELDQA